MKVSVEVSSYIFDLETGERESPIFTRPANSLLGNFLKRQFAMWANSTYVGEIDITGTAKTNASQVNYSMMAARATTTYGIVVGTGTNAVTIDDYKLAAGTAGSFNYMDTGINLDQNGTSSIRLTIWRTFTNITGNTVEIKEVGLQLYQTATGLYYLWDRTLHNLSVPNKKGCYICYIISFTK